MKITKKKSSNNGGERETNEGRVIVVGIRMDADSNELLTWSLVNIAVAGDLVIALHVSPPKVVSALDVNPSAFESMLNVYEGFCQLKQIDLKLKVCWGSSIRKILVREAEEFGAAKLILGVNKNPKSIGLVQVSIAKYCGKKLPHDCNVLAVDNGKIVFQRDAADSKKSKGFKPPVSLASTKSLSTDSDTFSIIRKEKDITLVTSSPTFFDGISEHGSSNNSIDLDDTLMNASQRNPCPVCEPANVGRNEFLTPKSKASNAPIADEGNSGWPIVKEAELFEKRASSDHQSRSVLQWAMGLRSRYTSSSLELLDWKPVKSKGHCRSKTNCIIVPTENAWVCPYKEVQVLPKELESLLEKYSSIRRVFSYEELVLATSNFAPVNLVGRGGNSSVYKGRLLDGKELAAKVLKHSKDNIKEFVSEVEITTSLFHKNIISLLGFCCENDNLILVYDLFSRGSLNDNLHGDEEKKGKLTWVERFKVAVGVAQALDYLHSGGSGQSVVHRDVKSSNILLSEDFQPQLSDFGLATKLSPATSDITCKDVAGTFGYLAPEYFMYGKVNEKVDAYAYGVLLLELLSGRKPIMIDGRTGQESLIVWAKAVLQDGNSKELIDPSLGNEYDSEQMERILLAASLCVKRAPQCRPQFDVLLKLLLGDEEVITWARLKVGDTVNSDNESTCIGAEIQSDLNAALLEMEEELFSISSNEQSTDASIENYLQGRLRHMSSFD